MVLSRTLYSQVKSRTALVLAAIGLAGAVAYMYINYGPSDAEEVAHRRDDDKRRAALFAADREVRVHLAVEGMVCTGCSGDVAGALKEVPGVLSASADHESGFAVVTIDPANLPSDETLIKALKDVNHPAKVVSRTK